MRIGLLILLGLGWAGSVAAQGFTTLKGHGGPIMDIAVAENGQVATASFDNSVGLWDGRDPRWLDGHEAAVNVVAHWYCGSTPEARWCGVMSGSDDFTVRDLSGPEPRILGRHKGKVTDLALSPRGGWLASASWDGTIGLWPLSDASPRLLHAPGGVNTVGFAAPTRLYAGTSTGSLLLYDLERDDAPLPLVQHGFGINELIVTGDWIAYGAVDGGTRIVSHDGDEIADFTLDRRPVLALSYHAGTGQLAVGDGHGYIMLVDTQEWQITRDFRATQRGPVWALAFSPDGQTIWAGGLDDVVYGWPVAMMDRFDPEMGQARSFLRDADSMPNGERQFMRKCSICHALTPGPSRKAGPSLHGVFGRPAGGYPGYTYSQVLTGSGIIWSETTIDALFDLGPDHYVPGSKMPMQRITGADDRRDLIDYLRRVTQAEN